MLKPRQVGPIRFKEKLDKQDEVFNARSSFLFKHVRVVRMVDVKRNTLVYLVYSDKLIDGSPKNSVTAVAVPAEQPIPVK
jgi:CreA protein